MDEENSLINDDERHPLVAKRDASKTRARRALIAALVFTTVFMIGEVAGGYLAHSLAIMTDAAHLLTDIGAMFLSLFAMWLSSHSPTSQMSFGFHRAEILGALASVLTIWALTGILVYEAIQRVLHIHEVHVDGKIMFIVASGGLCINLLDAAILHAGGAEHAHSHGGGGGHSHGGGGHSHGGGDGHSHGKDHKHKDKNHKHKDPSKKKVKGGDHDHSHGGGEGHSHSHGGERNSVDIRDVLHSGEPQELPHAKKQRKKDQKKITNINVHAAFIHVLGDCVQSVGVMGASALIWWKPEWKIADPIVTFVFSIIVLFTTVRLLKQSLEVLMEGVPQGVSTTQVQADLEAIPHVAAIHDLHIWSITVGQPALSVHLILDDATDPLTSTDTILETANRILREDHSILHTTIQIERSRSRNVCDNMSFHGHPKAK